MMAGVKKPQWLEGMIDFFFPPLCLGCGEYTENEGSICGRCLKAIETFDRPFCLNCMSIIPAGHKCTICKGDSLPLFAYGNYTSPLEDIVIQFKFKGIKTPAKYFARLLHEQFAPVVEELGSMTLAPIPLHPSRESRRGYNQAELLARELAQIFGYATQADLLRRIKLRKEQARLNHKERVANIRGVFEVAEEFDIDGGVILVDDVVTSGSTVREAAGILRTKGYRVVAVLAIAHAL
ncbi:MAG: ComF family protein [Candidatus Zixiibacteriota bacterium]